MRNNLNKIGITFATLLMAAAFTLPSAFAASQTYTGEVSDAMCGAKHQMSDAAACTRACVKHGSKYALVVGDKVYTLDAKDKAAVKLNELAGKKASVKGTAKGDTIEVSSVMAAK
jgi:hypothetical protein